MSRGGCIKDNMVVFFCFIGIRDKIGKLDNRDYIRQLIERGQMNEEQQRIYEDYKKSFLLREEERRIFDRTYTEHDTDKESPYSE